MNRRQYWAEMLPANRKMYLLSYINELPEKDVKILRTMLLDYSMDVIDDPLKNEYTERLSNRHDYSPKAAIAYFVERSPFWWHAREWGRFIVGHHRQVPIVKFNLLAKFAPHFPHISREDDSRIAMVMDQKKAEADIHTTMKIGRYLSKQTDAPESVIPDISNEYANRAKSYILEQAHTKAEIQWVYENGPHSCMGKKANDSAFQTPCHPTHAYASPDIEILYVRDLNNPNRVIARTVASAINKTWVRVFGNEAVILPLMTDLGYRKKRTNGLDNHRLLKIVHTDSIGRVKHVGPYLDSGNHVIHTDPNDEKYLIINPSDKEAGVHVGGTETSYHGKGFIDSPPLKQCHYCHNSFDNNHIGYYDYADLHACNDCASTYMINVFDRHYENHRVDPDSEMIFDATFVQGGNPYAPRHQQAITTSVEIFLSEEEFDESGRVQYRDADHLYLRAEEARYLPTKDYYIHADEVVPLRYTSRKYAYGDVIKVNAKYIASEHLDQEYNFKFTTLDGFPVSDIIENISAYFFKYVQNPMDISRVFITAVSKTAKEGYVSICDYWINQIDKNHGFDEYADVAIASIIPMRQAFCVIPDNEGLFENADNVTEMKRFSTSVIGRAFVAEIDINNMMGPLTFDERIGSRPFRNKPLKKRKMAIKPRSGHSEDQSRYAATSTGSTLHSGSSSTWRTISGTGAA